MSSGICSTGPDHTVERPLAQVHWPRPHQGGSTPAPHRGQNRDVGGFGIADRQRPFTAADGYTATELARFARDHLASAKALWERSFDCFDSAAVLCHFGIELILKALLLHSSGSFPATHDLTYLRRLSARSSQPIELTQAQETLLAKIDSFFSLRYPEPKGSPEIGDADFISIEALLRDLFRQLPAELRPRFSSGRRYQKGGRILMRKPKTKP